MLEILYTADQNINSLKHKLGKAKAEMTSNIRNDKERRESRKRSLTNDLNDAKTQ